MASDTCFLTSWPPTRPLALDVQGPLALDVQGPLALDVQGPLALDVQGRISMVYRPLTHLRCKQRLPVPSVLGLYANPCSCCTCMLFQPCRVKRVKQSFKSDQESLYWASQPFLESSSKMLTLHSPIQIINHNHSHQTSTEVQYSSRILARLGCFLTCPCSLCRSESSKASHPRLQGGLAASSPVLALFASLNHPRLQGGLPASSPVLALFARLNHPMTFPTKLRCMAFVCRSASRFGRIHTCPRTRRCFHLHAHLSSPQRLLPAPAGP
eukprot:209678-Pelagomonas_calceolata.AAC.1